MLIMSSMAASRAKKGILTVLLIGYLALLIYFLFFSEGFGRNFGCRKYHYNFIPFKEIVRFIKYRHILGFRAFFVNVFGNIIAFMPMGFFVPSLREQHTGLFFTVLTCFSVSLLVEVTQLVTRLGCCDVDDLILNTLGGLLGYLTYLILHKMMKKESQL